MVRKLLILLEDKNRTRHGCRVSTRSFCRSHIFYSIATLVSFNERICMFGTINSEKCTHNYKLKCFKCGNTNYLKQPRNLVVQKRKDCLQYIQEYIRLVYCTYCRRRMTKYDAHK